MTIATILQGRQPGGVVTLHPDATVADAVALLDSARAAFTTGVGVAAVLGAAVLVVVAGVVTVGLRPRRVTAERVLTHV